MEHFDLYKDIATRTGGDIYIGVVGPVRTGKSTFIKRFMDEMVIPNIENDHQRERARDELPQSATGTTVMTTEPKFVPNEAVHIELENNVSFKVRMIDCVGYMVPGATGHMDGDEARMINTPWNDEKMPFEEAAEIGTRKVINEHSTIGVVIATDGSVTDIPRESYIEAEDRVIAELKAIGKPFVMILNSLRPYSPETIALAEELSLLHGVPVIPLNCAQLKLEDINSLMERILYEFPIKELRIHLPKWIEALHADHWLKGHMIDFVKGGMGHLSSFRELRENALSPEHSEFIKKALVERILMGEGSADIEISVDPGLFYIVLSETIGMKIESDHDLISTIKVLSEAKREYDKVKYALEEVKQKGYGIVTPALEEMRIEEPKIVRHGSKYGVKIKASAPSIHLIRADIETEISPIVGSEEQSLDLIEFISTSMADDPGAVWEMNMFGRNMYDLVKDGLQTKLFNVPEDARMKFQDTLQRIINEGKGGLICIIF